MLKLALKYGLIAAAIMVAVIIAPFYWQDPSTLSERMKLGEVVGFLTMALAMALVYFALREQRSRLGGRLGFWNGVLTGAATTLVAAQRWCGKRRVGWLSYPRQRCRVGVRSTVIRADTPGRAWVSRIEAFGLVPEVASGGHSARKERLRSTPVCSWLPLRYVTIWATASVVRRTFGAFIAPRIRPRDKARGGVVAALWRRRATPDRGRRPSEKDTKLSAHHTSACWAQLLPF